MLNYAKLETGMVHYDVADVHVREVLTAAENLVAPQARAKGHTLAVADMPPDLAPAPIPRRCRRSSSACCRTR